MGFQKGNKINVGKHLSKETKLKMSLAAIGAINGLATRFQKGQAPWNKGLKGVCKASEETKQKMSEAHAGEKSWSWQGGKIKDSDGYILIYKPEHPFSSCISYIKEHRLVMEEFIGRFLTKEEVIHHINGIKDDNRIENLMLFNTNFEHLEYHRQLKLA